MSPITNPFGALRSGREQTQLRRDRAEHADRIAALLYSVDQPPDTEVGGPPDRGELQSLLVHLLTEYARGDDETKQSVNRLLHRFLIQGRRLLQGNPL